MSNYNSNPFSLSIIELCLLNSPPLTSKEEGPHGHFLPTYFALAVKCFHKTIEPNSTKAEKNQVFSHISKLLSFWVYPASVLTHGAAKEKSSNQERGRTRTSHFGGSKLLCQHNFPQKSFKVRLNIITSV